MRNTATRGAHTIKEVTIIGLDLAKRKFHLVGTDQEGTKIMSCKLDRSQVLDFFEKCPSPLIVAMEACGSCHYWGKEIKKLGHTVILLKPRDIKPYALSRQKNDTNDALAIAKAARDKNLRHVHLKSRDEQDLSLLHKIRANTISERIRKTNSLMSSLLEYGFDVGVTKTKFIKEMNALLTHALEKKYITQFAYDLLEPTLETISRLVAQEKEIDAKIIALNKDSPRVQTLLTIPGVGPINGSMLSNMPMESYETSRDFAASLGLVPRQNTTGGEVCLGSITKQGSRQVRTLLIQGARCLIMNAMRIENPLCKLMRWVKNAHKRLGFNKASVAIANKLARIAHACTTQKKAFQKR